MSNMSERCMRLERINTLKSLRELKKSGETRLESYLEVK